MSAQEGLLVVLWQLANVQLLAPIGRGAALVRFPVRLRLPVRISRAMRALGLPYDLLLIGVPTTFCKMHVR